MMSGNEDYDALGLDDGADLSLPPRLPTLSREYTFAGPPSANYRSTSSLLLRTSQADHDVYRSIGVVDHRSVSEGVMPHDLRIPYKSLSLFDEGNEMVQTKDFAKRDSSSLFQEPQWDHAPELQLQPNSEVHVLAQPISNAVIAPVHAFSDADAEEVVASIDTALTNAAIAHTPFNRATSSFNCSDDFRFDIYVHRLQKADREAYGECVIEVQRLSSNGPCTLWNALMERAMVPLESLCRATAYFGRPERPSVVSTRAGLLARSSSVTSCGCDDEEEERETQAKVVEDAVLVREYSNMLDIVSTCGDSDSKCDVAKLLASLSVSKTGTRILAKIGALEKILCLIQRELLSNSCMDTFIGYLCSVVASLASTTRSSAKYGAIVTMYALSKFSSSELLVEPLRQAARALAEFSKLDRHVAEVRAKIKNVVKQKCETSSDSILKGYASAILRNL